MATAKQIAARKLFAARARAGTLRKKSTTRKNPSQGSIETALKMLFREIDKGVEFPDAVHYIARMYKVKQSDLERAYDEAHSGTRRKNPSRGGNDAIHIDIDSHNTGGRNVRAKNPVKSEKLYTVHVANNGIPRYHIAHFRRLKDAKEYGQAYADRYGVEIAITSKPL